MHPRGLWPVAPLILLTLVVCSASAFDLRGMDIRIDPSGDAVVTLAYTGNPAEFVGIRALAASPPGTIREIIGPSLLSRDGEPLAFRVDCAGADTASVTVPGFAKREGGTYHTPEIRLAEASFALSGTDGYPLDLTPDVTVVFPDGYADTYHDTPLVPAVTHTVTGGQRYDPPPAPGCCREDKDLPLSGIIPDEVAPVAAVVLGAAATAAGVTVFGSAFSAWLARALSFIQNAVGQVFQGRLSDRDRERRTFTPVISQADTVLGISKRELGVIAAGAVIIGVLFLFADRVPVSPGILAIYIIMGGIALAVHEAAHYYLNRKYRATTEIQIWGLGTLIMGLTAWLFGSVFAQPTLTLVYTDAPLDRRSLGLIMLAGPVLSLAIAIACLFLVPLGGIWRTAGMIGFSINLLAAVFEMLPIPPCDGRVVWEWSRPAWAVVFVPLMALYLLISL